MEAVRIILELLLGCSTLLGFILYGKANRRIKDAEAQEAMLAHYKSTPKRGKFWYAISEDNLREIDGVVFRETCYDGQTYHKTFQMDELKALAEAE